MRCLHGMNELASDFHSVARANLYINTFVIIIIIKALIIVTLAAKTVTIAL